MWCELALFEVFDDVTFFQYKVQSYICAGTQLLKI